MKESVKGNRSKFIINTDTDRKLEIYDYTSKNNYFVFENKYGKWYYFDKDDIVFIKEEYIKYYKAIEERK